MMDYTPDKSIIEVKQGGNHYVVGPTIVQGWTPERGWFEYHAYPDGKRKYTLGRHQPGDV
jgi:hypothetical protein